MGAEMGVESVCLEFRVDACADLAQILRENVYVARLEADKGPDLDTQLRG